MRWTPWLILVCALAAGCPSTEVRYDRDGDGAEDHDDCDSDDPETYPGAVDPYGDDVDQNCDGVDGTDLDGDGFPADSSVDCDDLNALIHPDAVEDCANGGDEDCDGLIDLADPDCQGDDDDSAPDDDDVSDDDDAADDDDVIDDDDAADDDDSSGECIDSGEEENDSFATAVEISPGENVGFMFCYDDHDFYALELAAEASGTVELLWDTAAGNLDLRVYRPDESVYDFSVSPSKNEMVEILSAEPAGTWVIEVYGWDTGVPYGLTITID
jgi:hypothetical protein